MESFNPFTLPSNYFDAQHIFIFQYKSFESTGRSNTVFYNDVIVKKDACDEYMRLMREYIKKCETTSILRDIRTTTHEKIQQANTAEVEAYDSLSLFVATYVPYTEEEDEEEVQVMDIERIPSTSIGHMPCDVMVLMIVNEIDGNTFKTVDDALSFVTILMHTNKSLMSCLFSEAGEAVWRTLIQKYFDYPFVSIEKLEPRFFTEKYIGDSPLLLMGKNNENLIEQLGLHRRLDVVAHVGSEPYIVFMYMLLWRKDTSYDGHRLTKIHTDFGCYYNVFEILDEERKVTPLRILQFSDDKTFYINEMPFKSDTRLTSVIPFAYFSDRYDDDISVCILINRCRLLYSADSNTEWVDFGDISRIYPEITRCMSSGKNRFELQTSRSRVLHTRSDPHSFLVSCAQCVQPLVIPNNDAKKTNTIALIDFASMVSHLKNGSSTSFPLHVLRNNYEGDVIGTAIVVTTLRRRGRARYEDLYHLMICCSRNKWVTLSVYTIELDDGMFPVCTKEYTYRLMATTDEAFYRGYNFRLWQLFASFSDKHTLTLLTPEYIVHNFIVRMVDENDDDNVTIKALPVGDIAMTRSSKFKIDGHTGRALISMGNYQFKMNINDLRGDIVMTKVVPNASLNMIAKKMNMNALNFTPNRNKPYLYVLVCPADGTNMVAYSTKLFTREKLGFIGNPYCLQCDNTNASQLAHEVSSTDKVFCYKGSCQKDYYNAH